MPAPNAPLSAAERRAWRAAGWLLTGACGALTLSGLLAPPPAPPLPPTPVVAGRAAAAAAPAASPSPAPPAERTPKRRCS